MVIIAEIVAVHPAPLRAGFLAQVVDLDSDLGAEVFLPLPLPPGASDLVIVGAVVALELAGRDVVGVGPVDFRPDRVVVDLHRYPAALAA